MYIVIAFMMSGIGLGILLRKVNLGWTDKAVVYIIWLLLFLLGLEMGGDPNIVSALPTLGLKALAIAVAATTGSCIAAAALAKWSRLKYEPAKGASGEKVSLWAPLRGSLVILSFFAAGVLTGYFDLLGQWKLPEETSFYTLCLLILCVGLSIGHNKSVFANLRKLDRKILLLPLFTIVGTLLAVALLGIFLPYRLTEVLAIGSGQAYYSLSSILIAQSKGIELGTIALLANVIREIIALISAPFLPRIAGPLSPIAAGGATTADTTLPIIRQVCGNDLSVVSVYHGFLVDFSVPFMVALFCSM